MAPPLSLFPSQALDHQLKTIALEKFSFAVNLVGSGSHQWVHETRADELFLVFRAIQHSQGEDRADGRLAMSVSVGNQILEHQDLGKLVTIVEDFEDRRRKGLVDHALEFPVHVVIKFPCVALRYPTTPTLTRRIQMRFKNYADYQRVVNVFEQLKFPINNAVNREAPMRPLRPASASLVQHPSRTYIRNQPSTSNVAKNYETRASSTVNEASDALPRPCLTEDSPFFRRSHTASSETVRPGSSWSLDGSRVSDTVSSMSSNETLVRANSVLDHVGPGSAISGSQFERVTCTPPLSTSRSDMDHVSQPALSHFQDRSAVFSRSRAMSEASGPPLPNSQATPTSRVSFGSRYEFGQFRRATSGYEDSMVERFDIDRQIERRMSLVPEFLRPLSAPVPSNSETLSQCLPPRRELPFPKARVTTKPCTPIDLLPSLEPKLRAGESRVDGVAQFVAPANATPIFNRSMKRVAQRRTNYAPPVTQGGISGSLAKESPGIDGRDARPQMLVEREEEPSPLAAKSAAVSRPSTAPGLRSKVMGPATRKRPNETEPDMVPVSKQARKMVDRATQTQTWSGRDHTVPLALTTGVGRPLSTTIDEAIQHPESSMDDIEAFVSRHKQRPPPQELWQRPGYSEASPEERQAIINDFICENLDNEDFLKLCEDTGNVWRRIGLEL